MKILVIGDSCTDVFIYGYTRRLCPEGPVPILEPSRTITNQGMAGNVVACSQTRLYLALKLRSLSVLALLVIQ